MNFGLNNYAIYMPRVIFILSMLLKLGIAPFHSWLPHVISSISWTICMILATIQKIAPIRLLVIITPKDFSFLLVISVAASTIVGGVGGINQTQIRSLIAYSSIGHIG